MANLVGTVKWDSRIDGSRMPADAKRIGEKAGAEGAKGYDKGFDKNFAQAFEKTLSREGEKAFRSWQRSGKRDSSAYTRAFAARMASFRDKAFADFEGLRLDPQFLDKFTAKFDDADHAVADLRNSLDGLEGRVNHLALDAGRKQITEWVEERDKIAANDKIDRRLEALGKRLDQNAVKWRNLSANTRQWTLIIGAVASGMQDIAVLGSAAGAGLVAVGGAVSALGVGALSAVAVFSRLNQDLKKAPAWARPVVKEFQSLKTVFKETNDSIAAAAFERMGGAFTSLRATVFTLRPELEKMGSVLGDLTKDFAEAVAPGTEGFEQIQTLVRNSAPLFDKMARSAGTLGAALVRSFNRANPLVENLVDWVDTLIQRFDSFSRGTGFDVWMSNAEKVFGSLGPLIDATGRALNDLVTPESAQRTAEFLDRLTSFMPNLTDWLSTLGSFDVFGILAAALDDVGKALEPIMPALEDLAGVLRDKAIVFLDAFGSALKTISEITEPLIKTLTAFLDAIPPQAIQAAAVAVTALGTAFVGLKIARKVDLIGTSIGVLVLEMKDYIKTAGGLGAATRGMASKLTGLTGKAGMFGLLTAAAVGAGVAISDLIAKVNDWSGRATESVATGKGLLDSIEAIYPSFTYLGKEIDSTTISSKNLNDAMKFLADSGGTQWGMAMNHTTEVTQEAREAAADLAAGLGQLDAPLGDLANANLPAAQAQFQKWTDGMNLSDGELYNLIHGSLPKFEEALRSSALANGDLASKQDVVTAALGRGKYAMSDAEKATQFNIQALIDLSSQSGATQDQINSLSDAISGFSSEQLDARGASRKFESAMDDLTGSLKTNGFTLDDSTEKGRANNAAVDDLVSSTTDYAAKLFEQTGSQKKANSVLEEGRQQLIKQIKKYDAAGYEAGKYNDVLDLIPEDISTVVDLPNIKKAKSQIEGIDGAIRSVPTAWTTVFSVSGDTRALNGGLPTPDFRARGGLEWGPNNVIVGEAGPEAIVPLRRPLGQVDPSVRWLSAIAQNKPQAMASGGVVGGGKQVTVAEGAIVVSGVSDPNRAANEVVRRLFERVGG